MIGESLGPYKILQPLGAGGMGEVYLGEDTRLGRKVAIKVLPAEFASDPERLARFEQEARAAAALNHPHIAVVHDIGTELDEDGATTHFMVQEYLEGQSLRERLDKGALPLDKALDLAIEVGEALIAAHKAGIIHRDLKPDNVFLTEEGHAKVLDFGLAKLTEVAAPAGSSASMSPTMLGTVAGHVMGTAGYMAPEQVNGEEVDQRADLFAFGVVLYEAVTGKRAFMGESVPDTLSRILHHEPEPLASSAAATPAELERIVSKCLAKDPARRYQGAADLTVDLRTLAATIGAGRTTTTGKSAGHSPRPVEAHRTVPLRLALTAGVVLVAGTALVMQTLRPSFAPPTGAEVTIVVPDDRSFGWMSHRFLAIAPDGGAVVFTSGGLQLRRLGDRNATLLPGTAGARSPFFSPDGTQVGFFRGGLWRVAVDGGGPVLVTEEPGVPAGASWSANDTIYFGSVGGVWSVPAAGGDPELIVPVEATQSVFGPQLLPDQWMLYTLREGNEGWDSASIVALDLSTNERKLLVDEAMAATYVDSGHLLYVRDLELYAVGLDTRRMELDGAAAMVVSGVSVAQWGAAQYDVSRSGTLAYYGRSSDWRARLVLLDEDGDFLRAISNDLDRPSFPAVSPDGTRVVVQSNGALWVHHLDGRPPIRLPTVGATQAIWTPDGSEIVFEDGQGRMARVAADASGQPPQTIMATHHHPLGWTSDDRLVYSEISSVGSTSLFSMPLDDPSAATDLLVRETDDGDRAAVSPNGRWLAFTSNSTGGQEIWIMEIPGGSPLRISSGGADYPVWSPAGDELFYATGDAIMVVRSDDADSFDSGPPRQLFVPPRTTLGGQAPNFDVTDDGSFVILELAEADHVRGQMIEVSINWFEQLKRLVPTER